MNIIPIIDYDTGDFGFTVYHFYSIELGKLFEIHSIGNTWKIGYLLIDEVNKLGINNNNVKDLMKMKFPFQSLMTNEEQLGYIASLYRIPKLKKIMSR